MKVVVFGASGNIGRHIVEQALAAGHAVTAFVRDPAKLSIQHEQLRMMQGDVHDPVRVEEAVAGQDAVVSALGHTRGGAPAKEVMATGIRNVINAMKKHGVRRLVMVTGVGVPDERDPPSLQRRIIRALIRLLSRDVLEDAERATQTVRMSDLDWIVVRVPFVKEGTRTGTYRTGYLPERGRPMIARGDIADFILKQLTDNTYLRQAPMLMY